jgi:hypothetical protein
MTQWPPEVNFSMLIAPESALGDPPQQAAAHVIYTVLANAEPSENFVQ